MTDFFVDGDLVDVVIRGAELRNQSEHQVSLFLDGVDDPITVPLCDDGGTPLHEAVVIVPAVRPGELWQVRDTGKLLLATDHEGTTVLVGTDHKAYSVEEVVQIWGRLVRIAVEPEATDPVEGPTPDSVLVAGTQVQAGQSMHGPDGTAPALRDNAGDLLLCTEEEPWGLPYTATVYAGLQPPSPLHDPTVDAWHAWRTAPGATATASANDQPAPMAMQPPAARPDSASTVVMPAVTASTEGPDQ